MAKKWNKTEDQVETTPLWHGTDSDSVSKITRHKFDRGFAGTRNGKEHYLFDLELHKHFMHRFHLDEPFVM